MSVISTSITRSVGYDTKTVRLTEDAIPTMFDKLSDSKPKHSGIVHIWDSPMHPSGSKVPTNITLFLMTLCDRKREIFAFGPCTLTYHLIFYQHKEIHTNPTLVWTEAGCRGLGGCTISTSALAAANSSQLILPVTFSRVIYAVGVDIPESDILSIN